MVVSTRRESTAERIRHLTKLSLGLTVWRFVAGSEKTRVAIFGTVSSPGDRSRHGIRAEDIVRIDVSLVVLGEAERRVSCGSTTSGRGRVMCERVRRGGESRRHGLIGGRVHRMSV